MRWRMATSGVIQGPPDMAQPGGAIVLHGEVEAEPLRSLTQVGSEVVPVSAQGLNLRGITPSMLVP
jgi:hypothetical protein